MHSERNINELIPLIYDAAGNQDLWPNFLSKFAELLRSEVGTIYAQDLHNQQGRVAAVIGIDAAHQRSYEEYYAAKNIFFIRGKHLLVSGAVCTSDMMCPDRANLLKSEFYNDFMAPLGMYEGLNGVICKDRNWTGMIGLIRLKHKAGFNDRDVRAFSVLMPHLQRAFQLQRRLSRLEAQQMAAGEALNRWSMGVILIDQQGKVLLMNRSAESILNQRDGLSIAHGELRAASASETIALRDAMLDAIQLCVGRFANPRGTIKIGRPSQKRSLHIFVTPATTNIAPFAGMGAAAVMFMHDPEATESSDQDLLRQFYGLTATEAATAALLTQGKDVKEIADELHVSRETPRMHIKHIFEKTGTCRQAELVNLLMRGLAALRRAPK
jgi:DNA-binding CsgD family transcriptional regulator/PAS domain-containing protein